MVELKRTLVHGEYLIINNISSSRFKELEEETKKKIFDFFRILFDLFEKLRSKP